MNNQQLARATQPLMVVGVFALIAGLAWDAILHWADPGLAAKEGIFSLTNPGHILFGGGIALCVTGLVLQILFRPGTGRPYLRIVPAAALLALSAVSVGFGFSSESGLTGGGHSHDEMTTAHVDGDDHTRAEHAALAAADAGVEADATGDEVATTEEHGHPGDPEEQVTNVATGGAAAVTGEGDDQNRHDAGHEVAITLADNVVLQGQIEAARLATEKYVDIEAAKADGYVQITQFIPGLGMHMVNLTSVESSFDPAQPSQLLYEPTDDRLGWVLVGVAYSQPVIDENTPPPGFAGPLDSWHYHTDLCFGAWGVKITETEAECVGGVYVARTGWLCHFWLYKDSPEGMFSHENSLVS